MMIKETLIHSSDCRRHRDFPEIEFGVEREEPKKREPTEKKKTLLLLRSVRPLLVSTPTLYYRIYNIFVRSRLDDDML